jgi:hypothetical protein
MTVGVVTLQSNDMATVGASDFVLKINWRIFNNYLHPSITFTNRKTTITFISITFTNKRALNYMQ